MCVLVLRLFITMLVRGPTAAATVASAHLQPWARSTRALETDRGNRRTFDIARVSLGFGLLILDFSRIPRPWLTLKAVNILTDTFGQRSKQTRAPTPLSAAKPASLTSCPHTARVDAADAKGPETPPRKSRRSAAKKHKQWPPSRI